jgi:hypothetical protein
MPPQSPFLRQEIPQTLARLKWAAKILAGPDLSDILGFPQSYNLQNTATTIGAVSQLIGDALLPVGGVEEVEMLQNRGLMERTAFNSNPMQPFQVVPLPHGSPVLRLTKTVFKVYPQVEKLFSFTPQNLVEQQFPFIVYIKDIGDPTQPQTAIEHYFFGCWFADSVVKYSSTDVANTRLIQASTIKASRLLTLDQSMAGSSAATLLQGVFSGVLAQPQAQNLITNLGLT